MSSVPLRPSLAPQRVCYPLLLLGIGLVVWGCGSSAPDTAEVDGATTLATIAASSVPAVTATTGAPTSAQPATTMVAPLAIDESSFPNLADMVPVRGFFVDNLLGNVQDTVDVAKQEEGATYPVGSLVQLVPFEAMVKREPGFSPATNDWEFFELDADATGTSIRVRGGSEVVNRFGGSCSACHALAEPKYDLICEQDHGCEPLPIDRLTIEAFQQSDPRPLHAS